MLHIRSCLFLLHMEVDADFPIMCFVYISVYISCKYVFIIQYDHFDKYMVICMSYLEIYLFFLSPLGSALFTDTRLPFLYEGRHEPSYSLIYTDKNIEICVFYLWYFFFV